jgi:hypothetical protein
MSADTGDRMKCNFLITLFGVLLVPVIAGAGAVQTQSRDKPAHAKPAKIAVAKPLPFSSAEAVMAWIGGYRHKPEPQRLGEAVRALIGSGTLNDPDGAGMYFGFVAGVLGANPAQSRVLVASLFPMPPEHQVLVVKAIAFSGLADWKTLLTEAAERMPARTVLIDKYLYKDGVTLDKLALDTGAFAMDANWGFYFATGSAEPVERIIASLAWSTDKNNVERLTLGNMAKWTLASNAQRSPDLLAICKASVGHQSGAVAVALADAIDAAETFEVGRIRKVAMSSVEQLKQKGPESTRNAQWWGQAGTTVLALGCVGASVLGQVQIGIPCVLGGALSTAATKFLLPQ